MKHLKHLFLTSLVAMVSCLSAMGYDFESKNSDGVIIYYRITPHTDLTCAVTYRDPYNKSNAYSGTVSIPSSVVYNGKTYSVTSIGYSAFEDCSSLTSVEIPNSVTKIESSAFAGCSSLTSIVIPNSVTSIGDYAFSSCSSLTSIVIPNSVTKIADFAFTGCSSLTSVEIPNSVTSIGDFAFSYCSSLTSVVIPNSVTWIGDSTFFGDSNLRVVINQSSLNITKGSPSYGYVGYYARLITDTLSEDGFYYSDEGKTKLLIFDGRHSSVIIPNSVTEIGDEAFEGCSSLTSVVIPNSITEIGSSAFEGCSNLKSLTIGTGVTSVGSSAFRDCSSLYKLTLLPNTVPSGLAGALPSASSEGRITYVANNNYSGSGYGTIKKYDYLSSAFEVDGVKYVPVSPSERTCAAIDCNYDSKAKNVVVEENVSYRGVQMKVVEINPYLFIGNDSIESIEVPIPLSIPKYFAKGCSYIQTLKLNNTGEIGDYAFHNCAGLKTLTMGNTVTNIGDYAFNGCVKLVSAALGNKITKLGENCFNGCTSLPNIIIPSSVLDIGDYSFYRCTSLAEISLNEGLKTIGSYSFQHTKLTSIAIPSSTTSIGDGTFNGCASLARFEAKDGKETLALGANFSYGSSNIEGEGLFYDCPLKEIKIGRPISYNTNKNYGYSPFYRNKSLEKVTLTDVPTEVFTNEFYGCTALKEVNLGDGVTKIGDYAFSGCSALESFSFGKSVTTIGNEAFSDCTAMTKLYAEPTTPPTCGTQALDDINKWNCTLYVDESAINTYKTANQWKEFFFMEAYDFTSGIEAVRSTADFNGTYRVYDMNGTMKLVTKDADEIKSLRQGVYIVNGKKIAIK